MGKRTPKIASVLIASAIAIIGLTALLLVNHGPWSGPQVKSPPVVRYSNTSEAAEAAGATVTPTPPKDLLEPTAPGPKPVQPAIPNQSRH